MRRANSIRLRSVLSAAVVCAVLRAATIGGADRAGSLPNGNIRETGPILVRSISTIKMPVCPAARNLISESRRRWPRGTVKRRCNAVRMRRRRSMTFPSSRANPPASSRSRSRNHASLRTRRSFDKLDRVRQKQGRDCRTRRRPAVIQPDLSVLRRRCARLGVSIFRDCPLSHLSSNVSIPDANGLNSSAVMRLRDTQGELSHG